MKKQQDLPMNLREAFSATPDMCKKAVLHAVGTYREGRRMKKTYVTIWAAVFILILACGTALALVRHYSVKDSVAGGQSSQAFDGHIVNLEQTKEIGGLIFSLSDAVFDGQRFAAAMNISAAEGAKPMFIEYTLEGWSGGEKLGVDATFNRNSEGFLFPAADSTDERTMDVAVNADVYGTAGNDIRWKLRVNVYEINWPMENIPPDANGVLKFPREDALREAFLNERIVASGHSLTHYLTAVRLQDETWLSRVPVCGKGDSFGEMMVAAGGFTKNQQEFDFSTTLSEPVWLARGEIYRFDEFDVAVKAITQTFMQVNYELEIRYHEHPGAVESVNRYENELAFSYSLFDQDGNRLKDQGGIFEIDEDLATAHVHGSCERISDEPLTAIAFRLDETYSDSEYYTRNVDRLAFTVAVKP